MAEVDHFADGLKQVPPHAADQVLDIGVGSQSSADVFGGNFVAGQSSGQQSVHAEPADAGSQVDGPQRHRVHHRHDRAEDDVFDEVSQSQRHPGVLAVEVR